MYKNISTTIKKINRGQKGDYLVYLRQGLSWKHYQDKAATVKHRI